MAPAGLLLVVTYASVPPWSWADPGTVFPTPVEALAALELDLDLDHWEIVRLADPHREATAPVVNEPPSPTPSSNSAV